MNDLSYQQNVVLKKPDDADMDNISMQYLQIL